MKEKILITGGAGFIGSNAANILSKDFNVVAFDNLSFGRKEYLSEKVRFELGSVRDIHNLKRITNVDYIIHLASVSSSQMFPLKMREAYGTNILGLINVLEYACKNRIKKVLFSSSSSLYGDTKALLEETNKVKFPNFYTVAKYCEEETARLYSELYNMEIMGFRFMSIYGPNEEHKGIYANLVSQFIWDMVKGKRPKVYGDGFQTRDFTNVNDVVQAFKLAIEMKDRFGFEIFNVGTGTGTDLNQLIYDINKCLGTEIYPEYIANKFGKRYIWSQRADIRKINKKLNYCPSVELSDGIKRLLKNNE